MSRTAQPIPFKTERLYVIVSPGGMVAPWTAAYWRKQAIDAAEKWTGDSWNDLKESGYRVERCSLSHEWDKWRQDRRGGK